MLRRAPTRTDLFLGVLAAGWVGLLFHAFSPGLMSRDSLDQYAQGLSGEYSNAHPPFMSFLLGLSARATNSPWPFLMLDLLMLAFGMALLARDGRPEVRRWGFVVFVAYLLLPTTWSLAVVLWKDTALAGVMLLCVVALHRGQLKGALALMVVASLLRHNAIIALIPLLAFAALQVPALAKSRLRTAAAVMVATGLLALPAPIVERVSRAKDTCMLCMPAILDLSAVYVDSPELFPGSLLTRDVGIEDLRATYTPSTMIFILYGDTSVRRVSADFVVSHRKEILAEWLEVIPQRPVAYLKSRFAFFAHLLGLKGDVFYAFHIGIDTNDWGLRVWQADTALYRAFRTVQEAARNTLAFRGWFWLGLSTILCLGLARQRPRSLALATAASGFLFTATLLFLAPSADFRYLYWTVVSCFATALLVLATPPPPEPVRGGE
jgi:hypothetical protein